MILYEMYQYTKKDIKNLEKIYKKFKELNYDEHHKKKLLDEHLFQFSPLLMDKNDKNHIMNEHEKWVNFHINSLYNVIIEIIIKKWVNDNKHSEYVNSDIYNYYLENEAIFHNFIDFLDNINNKEKINQFLNKIYTKLYIL